MGNVDMTLRHKIGDNVIYKNNGICEICDIREMSFAGAEKKPYYVLKPVYSLGSHTYVPADLPELEQFMHTLLAKEEIHKIIDNYRDFELLWNDDTKARAEYFNSLISSFDRCAILAIAMKLSEYKTELDGKRKKMYASDSKILSLSEKMIKDEFAFVLEIKRDEVFGYIKSRLSK